MSVFVDIFARWKGFYPLHDAITIDDGFNQLNRNFAVYQNLAFAISSSIRLFLHHPSMHSAISCDGFVKFDKIFAHDYCWTQGLYTIKEAYNLSLLNVPYPGVIPEEVPTCVERPLKSGGYIECPDPGDTVGFHRIYHLWYQWIHIYFWMNVFLFYVPHIAFKQMGFGELKPLLQLVHHRIESDAELDKTVEKASSWLALKYITLVQNKPRPLAFIHRHRLGFAILLIKFTYLLLSIVVFYSTGQMFELGNFYTYGADWFREVGEVRNENVTRVSDVLFPKVASCEVKRWGTSGLEEEQGMCILPVNILYQYLFLAQYFVLLTLIVSNSLSLVITVIKLPLVGVTYQRLLSESFIKSSDNLRYIYHKSGSSGRIILHLLSANMPCKLFEEILTRTMEKVVRRCPAVSQYIDEHCLRHVAPEGAARFKASNLKLAQRYKNRGKNADQHTTIEPDTDGGAIGADNHRGSAPLEGDSLV